MEQFVEVVLQDYRKPKARKKPRKNRLMLHEYNGTNDIKLHGPLSYRHLRIIAWVTLALAQVGVLMAYGASFDKNVAKFLGNVPYFLQYFDGFMMPLFLIANFSIILTVEKGYKNLIIKYALSIAAIYALFALLHEHYFVGMIAVLTGSKDSAREAVDLILQIATKGKGVLAFNIFVDMFLCTLFTFFVNYHPTKFFQGKWIYLFRSFAILPALYEVACIVLKIRASFGDFNPSVWFWPALTTKPPMLFVAFVILALFIKVRERIFLSRGFTYEEYKAFLKTNINSVHFAIFTAVLLLLITAVDMLLSLTLSFALLGWFGDMTDVAALVKAWGFGECAGVTAVIPIVLLFNYTKTYKNKTIDVIIPIAGIGLLGFVYLEGLYWFVQYLPDLIKGWTGNLFK